MSPTSPVWLAHDVSPPGVNFTEIVEAEQQQREARQRAANKPLSLIQVQLKSSIPKCNKSIKTCTTTVELNEFGSSTNTTPARIVFVGLNILRRLGNHLAHCHISCVMCCHGV